MKYTDADNENSKGDSSDDRTDLRRVRLWSSSHQHAKDTDADKERGPLGKGMVSILGGHNGNGLSSPNGKDMLALALCGHSSGIGKFLPYA